MPLFDKSFYETYLEELGPLFGLTNYKAHPYTDVLILRINTCLTCMNFGAGYYKHHTPEEYIVAEEMENAVVMGVHLINRLGYNEYLLPYSPIRDSVKDKENYEWLVNRFRQYNGSY